MLAGALVLVVLAALAVVAVTRDDGARPGRQQAQVVAAPSAELPVCSDVLVLGIDGNGEKPRKGKRFGPTVDKAVAAVVAGAQARARTVDKKSVTVRTKPASALVPARSAARPTRSQLSRARAVAWQKPVGAGVKAGIRALDTAATTCADQQLVLVGYAQGASVVHRMLLGIAKRAGLRTRLVGALLVSDPDRRTRTKATRLGSPAAARKSQAVLPSVGRAVADTPAPDVLRGTWSICTRGDLVCAPSATPVRKALALARSYTGGKGAAAVARAADAVTALVARRPVPEPRRQVLSLAADAPASVQLRASAPPGTAVAWRATSALPAGLSLSATGVLSGTPTAGALTTTTYAVRGTSPATPEVGGVLSIRVASSTDAVAAGGRSGCEIHADGSAWCWGGNQWGQVGDGTTTERHAPVPVGSATDWASIDTSGATSCGVRTGGALWCWGLNTDAQLGIGADNQRNNPVQVGTTTTWAQVSTGWHHTCAVRTDGTLWCWGLDDSGQLGTGDRTARPRPVQVGTGTDWSQVQVGGFFSCGLRSGTAWCWGGNGFGQLGSPAGTDSLVPVQVPGLTGLVSLGASWGTTCATAGDGAAWCWGRGDRGQLGNGVSADSSTPTRVSGDQTWTSIAVGDSMTCGVDSTGRGWCWGDNRYGQLGDGTTTPSGLPVRVASPTALVDVAAGWFSGCAALVTGRTTCWGNNELGQVGDGTTTNAPTPKEIP